MPHHIPTRRKDGSTHALCGSTESRRPGMCAECFRIADLLGEIATIARTTVAPEAPAALALPPEAA